MLGESPLDSAVFAAAVAAISVTRKGAQPSMPSMAEVKDFMRKPRRGIPGQVEMQTGSLLVDFPG
jgi:hypothetical protein